MRKASLCMSCQDHSFHVDSAWALIEFPAISTKSDLDEASMRCIIHLHAGRPRERSDLAVMMATVMTPWSVAGFCRLSTDRQRQFGNERSRDRLQNHVVRGCRICQPGIVRTCGAYEWRSPSNSWAPLQPWMLLVSVLLKVPTKKCIRETAMIYAWHMTDTLKIVTSWCFVSSRFRNAV